MDRFIVCEFAKLKRTLAAPLALTAPLLAVVMAALIATRQPQAPWSGLVESAAALWAYFVLPMSVAAMSALIAQIEHAPRTWDYLLALPFARWRLFAAKAVVISTLVAVMSLALPLLTFVAGRLLPSASAPTGEFPWAGALALMAMMAMASLFQAAMQLWAALRFSSFVVPIVLGLAGTFVVVAGMGAPELVYVPWAMPINLINFNGADPAMALSLGALGGVLTFALMILHLSTREI